MAAHVRLCVFWRPVRKTTYAAAFIAREADKAQLYTVLPGVQDGDLIRYTVLRPAMSDLGEEGPTCTEVCRSDRIVTVTTGADRSVTLSVACSCQTLTSVGLACRHIDAVATVRQEAKSFPPYMAHVHWARVGPAPEDLMVALQARAAPPPPPCGADGGSSRRRLVEPEVKYFLILIEL